MPSNGIRNLEFHISNLMSEGNRKPQIRTPKGSLLPAKTTGSGTRNLGVPNINSGFLSDAVSSPAQRPSSYAKSGIRNLGFRNRERVSHLTAQDSRGKPIANPSVYELSFPISKSRIANCRFDIGQIPEFGYWPTVITSTWAKVEGRAYEGSYK